MSFFAKIINFFDRLFTPKAEKEWRGTTRNLPGVHHPDAVEAAKKLLALGEKSTWVQGWYSHRYGNGDKDCAATVRGPFCRWLLVTEGGGWDETKGRPNYVADPGDDADFIAFALNNAENIASFYLDLVEALFNQNKAEFIMSVDWKHRYDTLMKLHDELHNKCGLQFSSLVDSHEHIENLKKNVDGAVLSELEAWRSSALLGIDIVRLLKENKPLPSVDTLEKMVTEPVQGYR